MDDEKNRREKNVSGHTVGLEWRASVSNSRTCTIHFLESLFLGHCTSSRQDNREAGPESERKTWKSRPMSKQFIVAIIVWNFNYCLTIVSLLPSSSSFSRSLRYVSAAAFRQSTSVGRKCTVLHIFPPCQMVNNELCSHKNGEFMLVLRIYLVVWYTINSVL
jgi:hypothetical protein